MSKIFCDLGDVPKNKKRGSMKECAELGQAKYWGEKKMDQKLIELVVDRKQNKKKGSSTKSMEKEMDALKIKFAGLKGKIKRLTRELEIEEDKKEIKKKKAEKKDFEKEILKIKEKMIKLKNKMDEDTESKKGSKKKSLSRTKKNSKKKSKKNSKKNSNKKHQ
jgi:hypothetical protein